MKQMLIVEGSDAIVLSKLCKIRRLPPPVGYASEGKFRDEFVKNAGGFDNALFSLEEALGNPENTNIGLVVDANDKGLDSRWAKIKNILENYFSEDTLQHLSPVQHGIIVVEPGLPKVGIWIMPDNQNPGYLEHFITQMIPAQDEVLNFAKTAVDQIEKENFCKFKPSKRQKALVHTWLAWQEEPGKPFGTALDSKYLDANAPIVNPFLQWMQGTFLLG